MKLRNPLMIRVVALLLSWVLRLWLGTLNFRAYFTEGSTPPLRATRQGVYVFWHEMMLLPTLYARHGFAILTSRHADGELVAQVMRMLGGNVVRGSTSKAGVTALRGMMRTARGRHLAITPDGPRGPRRVLKPGAVFLASRTGRPVVPVGCAFRRCRRHRSWDRMAFPIPGTLAVVVVGRPLEVPPDLDRDELEHHRTLAQHALDDAQRRAEELAAAPTGNYAPRGREVAAL